MFDDLIPCEIELLMEDPFLPQSLDSLIWVACSAFMGLSSSDGESFDGTDRLLFYSARWDIGRGVLIDGHTHVENWIQLIAIRPGQE